MSAQVQRGTKKALQSLQTDVTALLKVANRAQAIAEELDRLGVEAPECVAALSNLAIYLPHLEVGLIEAVFPDLQAAGITELPEDGHYLMESDSRKGVLYHIEQTADENGEIFYLCDCPAGIHRRSCKHTKRLSVLLTRG